MQPALQKGRLVRSVGLIESARLIVDGLRPEDADALFAYRSDPAVIRYQGWRPTCENDAADFIAEQASVPFASAGQWCQRAVRLRDGGALIGDLGLHFPDESDGAVEMGISLAPAYQGRGFAREAYSGGRSRVGSARLSPGGASVDPRNLASVALLGALGMRQEAHHRESLFYRDDWVDYMIFALLASEWPVANDAR